MIKALQCGEAGMFLTPLIALTTEGPRCIRLIKGKCEIMGKDCPAKPVRIYDESEHLEVQAALEAAEGVVLPMARTVDYIMKYPDAGIFGFIALNLARCSMFADAIKARKALTKIRRSNG